MGAFDLGTGLLDGFVRYRGYSGDPYSSLEDFADRLSHLVSSLIILLLAGVTMTNVYFLRPISCTLPTAPDGHFTVFAESLCWVQGTIGLKVDDALPNDAADWAKLKERSDISFYQWVPFCLSIQAMLFYLPHLIWQALAINSLGDNLECLLTRAKKANQVDDRDARQKLVNACADHLSQLSRQHADNRTNTWSALQHHLSRIPGGRLFIVGKRMGNRIAFLYLLVKLLYIANALGQLFMIMKFLGHRDLNMATFAQDLFNILKSKREWGGSEFFPRQTLCPVRVPHLGVRNQVYTAVCALPVNMFNEKIYIFLWLWISLVLLVSVLSLLTWLSRLALQRYSRNFLREFLAVSLLAPIQLSDSGERKDGRGEEEEGVVDLPDDLVNKFLREVVRCDGNFIIRMLRVNAGDVVTGEILARWWRLFMQSEERKRRDLYAKMPDYMPGFKVTPDAPPMPQANGEPMTAPEVKQRSGARALSFV
nr:unnamed protein product [Spirometra erinaceieuropaei]